MPKVAVLVGGKRRRRQQQQQQHKRPRRLGKGILNTVLDHLPISATLANTNYCGPQSNSEALIKAGVKPASKLDAFCLEHKKTYNRTSDDAERSRADKQLLRDAWSRVGAVDSGLSERAAALVTAGAMKGKLMLGQGLKRKKRVCRRRPRRTGQRPQLARILGSGPRRVRRRRPRRRKTGGAFYLRQFKKKNT